MASQRVPWQIGVVGIADAWSSEHLAGAVAERTGHRLLIDLRRVVLDLAAGTARYTPVDGPEIDLTTLDAIIVKKIGRTYRPELLDRLEILHFVESRGVRVFSPTAAMIRLLDRMSCTVALRAADIPMPDTVITEDCDHAAAAVQRFGRAILKPLYTSKARGMLLVEDGPNARHRIAAFQEDGNPVLYLQRLVELPGNDLGIVFLGGEYLATYARAARSFTGDPYTHTRTRYCAHEPAPAVIALAQRAQAIFNLDFTCVDVVETAAGPLIFEVSAFGGFRGLQEACGIDAAARYVDHVLRVLENGR